MPYRFAIIGCGQIGQRHATLAAAFGQVAAVCDIIPEKAANLADKYNAVKFTSFEHLVQSPLNIDVIVICTPNGLHAAQSILALNNGFHVLCEKPMAIFPVDAHAMLAASKAGSSRLFIVKQNRFNSPVQLVRNLLQKNALGRVHAFQLNCFWNRSNDYFDQSDWRGTILLDGGPLFTQFSHFIDLLYWFLGDVVSIDSAVGRNVLHGDSIEFEDEGTVLLTIKNAVTGTIQYSLNAYNSNMEGSLTLFGEKGTIKIGGSYLNRIDHFEVKDHSAPIPGEMLSPNDYGSYQGSMNNHHQVYAALVKTLEQPDYPFMDSAESIKTVEIISCIYDLMRQPKEERK
jgi:UDP-N-acetyl-2-amino-2-deoxyglucuronate dehydrogenase